MTYVTDGTNGEVEYKVLAADDMWNQEGSYRSQCIVRWTANDDYATEETRFRVRGRRQV